MRATLAAMVHSAAFTPFTSSKKAAMKPRDGSPISMSLHSPLSSSIRSTIAPQRSEETSRSAIEAALQSSRLLLASKEIAAALAPRSWA